MTEYPALRFYSSASFVPFDRIKEIDQISPPDVRTTFYIHNESALAGVTGSAKTRRGMVAYGVHAQSDARYR